MWSQVVGCWQSLSCLAGAGTNGTQTPKGVSPVAEHAPTGTAPRFSKFIGLEPILTLTSKVENS